MPQEITFISYIADLEFMVTADVTPGRPQINPDLKQPGAPEEGAEIEIKEVRIVSHEKRHATWIKFDWSGFMFDEKLLHDTFMQDGLEHWEQG